MNEKNINSHKGFNYGILGSLLIVIMVIITKSLHNLNSDTSSMIIGLLTISAGIISIVGLINSLKGVNDSNTYKKVIGLILNIGITLLFIYVIAANVSDLYKYFTNSF